MPNVNFDPNLTGGVPNAAASFFASLNAAFSGGSPGTGLFDKLLSELPDDAADAQPPADTPAAVTSTPSADPNDPLNVADQSTLSSLQDVVSAWSGFIQKWQNYQQSHSSQNNQNAQNSQSAGASQQGASANAASGQTPSAGNAPNVTSGNQNSNAPMNNQSSAPQTSNVATGPGAPANGTSAANNPGTTGAAKADTAGQTDASGKPPSLDELVAELQSILKMLRHRIQSAKIGADDAPASGTPAGPAASTATNSSGATAPGKTKDTDLLSAADMMIELLLLSQYAQKKLALAQDGAAPAGGNASGTDSSTASPSADASGLASLDTQLRGKLKDLLDALQANAAAGNGADEKAGSNAGASGDLNAGGTPGTQNAPAPATSNSADGLALSGLTQDAEPGPNVPSPSSQLPSPGLSSNASPPQTIVNDALNVATNFLKQLENIFEPVSNSTSASSAPAPISPNAAANLPLLTGADGSGGADNTWLDSGSGNDDGSNAAGGNGAPAILDPNTPILTADGSKAANPYSFASQLSALRAAQGGMTGLPSAVEQVMLQLSRNVKSGNDQMSLQLHPADLGRIDIKLDMSGDGKVQGTVMASNPATLQLLLKDVRGLERALQEAGLSADPGSLQFSLGNQTGNTQNQMPNNMPSGSSSNDDDGLPDDLAAIDATQTTETWYVTPGRVNLQV